MSGLAVSLATLTGLSVMTTARTFERERRHVEENLRDAAQREIDAWDDFSSVEEFLAQMAGQPAMAALDPVGCGQVFDGLRGLIPAHVHLLRVDGSEVCRLDEERARDVALDPGAWLAETLAADGPVHQPAAVDPHSGTPAVLSALRVDGPDGPVGAVAAVVYSGVPPIDQPKDLPRQTSLFVVDADRTLVLATTPNRSRLLGAHIDGQPPVEGDMVWAEATGAVTGWHAQAALPRSVALGTAHAELRRTLLVGGASVAVVLVLGVLLHHRLVRPVRRLRAALLASLEGDRDARAPVEGPAEVAEAAQIFNDLIAEREAHEAELAWKATHDVLTGLPNRASLTQQLDDVLATGAADPAVMFLDLDRFKLVNDSHGHAVGDRALIALGRRLVETVGEAGTVGRFGGDEFVAVCPHIGGEEGALAMAARIAEALRAPVRFSAHEIWLAGSVGIAVAHPGDTAEDLIRNADTAMYRAKDAGRDGHAVFDQAMREWSVRRLNLERDLNHALEERQLVLHYQPKFALRSAAPVGVEALLRWPHPQRGTVGPDEFIPVAEETGLILPIGRMVIAEAAAQAARWRRAGRPLPVAVNLSCLQLADPSLPAQVYESLQRAGALPADLVVEITESAVLQDVEGATQRLHALRELGVRVSIDDFGTGYSSLSYLERLPIDELKIDRSFVQRLGSGPTAAIVGSVVDLAHALGLSVVAEGIETEDQLAALRGLDCDVGQGFLLGRPQERDAVDRLLAHPMPGTAASPE